MSITSRLTRVKLNFAALVSKGTDATVSLKKKLGTSIRSDASGEHRQDFLLVTSRLRVGVRRLLHAQWRVVHIIALVERL